MALVASGVAPPAAPAPTINAQLVPTASGENTNSSSAVPIKRPQVMPLPMTTQSLNILGAGQPGA